MRMSCGDAHQASTLLCGEFSKDPFHYHQTILFTTEQVSEGVSPRSQTQVFHVAGFSTKERPGLVIFETGEGYIVRRCLRGAACPKYRNSFGDMQRTYFKSPVQTEH